MKIDARAISPGRAEARVIVSPAPFSFVGGVDPSSGVILDNSTGHAGASLRGRVLAFPHGKGSTVGSYVLYGLVKKGSGPVAIVNAKAEAIVATGAILAEIPLVDRFDINGLRTGDRVVVDGSRGSVELPDLEARFVVTAILRNRGRILIVRRSEAVGTFQGRWSAISGYLEDGDRPEHRARQEVWEETGIRTAALRASRPPILARQDSVVYVVHPFLFDVSCRRVRLDWENAAHRWVRPDELRRYKTVPRLADVVTSVLSS